MYICIPVKFTYLETSMFEKFPPQEVIHLMDYSKLWWSTPPPKIGEVFEGSKATDSYGILLLVFASIGS